jgi:hypothetical protein
MTASLGPSWNLHSNTPPRCLTAYAAITTDPNGNMSTSSTSGSAPFGGGGDSSNPFDDEASHYHYGVADTQKSNNQNKLP